MNKTEIAEPVSEQGLRKFLRDNLRLDVSHGELGGSLYFTLSVGDEIVSQDMIVL